MATAAIRALVAEAEAHAVPSRLPDLEALPRRVLIEALSRGPQQVRPSSIWRQDRTSPIGCIEAALAAEPASEARVARGRGETVLLGEEMLATLGYEPVGFDSAQRALAAFRSDPGRFDLALTDEVMPGMTGTALAAELRQIRPGLPVVLVTGHGGPIRADRLRVPGIREVLRKPLALRTIAESLARTLRGSEGTPRGPGGNAGFRAEA